MAEGQYLATLRDIPSQLCNSCICLLLQGVLQHRQIVRNKTNKVSLRLRGQGSWVGNAFDWSSLDKAIGDNVETVQDSQKENVQLPVGQLHADTHSASGAEREDWCVWSFKPPLRTEDLWVFPEVRICKEKSCQ